MIFLDTSFLVAVELEKDENHQKAVRVNREIASGKYGKAYVSDYVFDEVTTLVLGRTRDLTTAVLAGNYLRQSVNLIKLSENGFDESWQMFKNQKSGKLSFTDCTILSVLKQNNIDNIATFDSEFDKINWINVIK